MADSKISALSAETTLASDDMLVVATSGGASKKITGAALQPWLIVSYPFTFATAGLATGVTVYTPAVGDILYNAWIEITVAFNGTTPKADVSQFLSAQNYGVWGWTTAGVDLTNTDSIENGNAPNYLGGPSFGGDHSFSPGLINSDTVHRNWGHFTTTDPLLLIATQNGQRGGTAIDSTVGTATLRLLILRP